MSELENAISDAIKKMSLIKSYKDKIELENKSKQYSFDDWKIKMMGKTGGVGFLTGLPGGPAGLVLEAGDISYLLSTAGRACYGVGHILGRKIDYKNDIPLILAIWSGAAEAASYIKGGKVGVKVSGKIGTKSMSKVAGKVVAKTAIKSGSKASQKIVAKATTKFLSKLAAKAGTKWIPLIGGAVGAGINACIMNGMIEAAYKYYKSRYVVFSEDIAESLHESSIAA